MSRCLKTDCESEAMTDSNYCFSHQPELDWEMKNWDERANFDGERSRRSDYCEKKDDKGGGSVKF